MPPQPEQVEPWHGQASIVDGVDIPMDYLDRVAEKRDPTHVAPGERLCPECFTYHVGGCA